MTKGVSIIFVLWFFVLFSTGLNAQNSESKIFLFDFEKVKEYLSLNEKQVEEIRSLVAEIGALVQEDEEMQMKMQGIRERGERPDRGFMMNMRQERKTRAQKVGSLIEDIKEKLNEEQIIKFDDIKLPNLTMQRRGIGGF